MKFDSALKVKNVSERIGVLPFFGKCRQKVEVIVAPEQCIEDQLVNALRLSIGSDPRVQVRGAVFDQHHHRVRIRRMRAARKTQQRAERYDGYFHGVSVSRCSAAWSTALSLKRHGN